MAQLEKVKILPRFDLFNGLPAEVLEVFAEKMHHVTLWPMQQFVEEGVDSDKAYFIYEGIASIFRTSIEGEIVHVEFRADLLWGTRARVTEVLHDLANEGKIIINHRKITVIAK